MSVQTVQLTDSVETTDLDGASEGYMPHQARLKASTFRRLDRMANSLGVKRGPFVVSLIEALIDGRIIVIKHDGSQRQFDRVD